MDMRARRSVLYVPATNAKAMEKVAQLPCDAVIFDLEDAVAPDAKAEARQRLVDHIAASDFGRREIVIRVNTLATEWGADDVAAAAAAKPHAVLLPKVESADELADLRKRLDAAGGSAIRLWAMIETPAGLVDLRDILRGARTSALGLECLVAGTNDIAKDTGLPLPAGRATIELWLAGLVLHARAFGVDVLDGVFNDFRNAAGFEEECRKGAALGFDGKTLIHPGQIDVANTVFAPSEAAVAEARTIVAAFDEPENRGKGVISIGGRMVERLHAEAARKLLSKAAIHG